jgi:hypothetical protein
MNHPNPASGIPIGVFDRTLPLATRRRLYIEWAEGRGVGSHTHPGRPAQHSHAGGHLVHDHKEEIPR